MVSPFLLCDPGAIQTHDLQNRNLILVFTYSTNNQTTIYLKNQSLRNNSETSTRNLHFARFIALNPTIFPAKERNKNERVKYSFIKDKWILPLPIQQ